MKASKAWVTRPLNSGALIDIVDNTGAREIQIISVQGYRGVKNRIPKAGIGDMVVASVRKGTPDMRKQIVKAVIIRQKKEYRRPDGTRIAFEDNAAVVVDEKGEPRGTEIKGPVAREAAERFGKIASAATMVV